MRVRHLAPEQRTRLPEFIEQWTKIGLSTHPDLRPILADGTYGAHPSRGPPATTSLRPSGSAGRRMPLELRVRLIARTPEPPIAYSTNDPKSSGSGTNFVLPHQIIERRTADPEKPGGFRYV